MSQHKAKVSVIVPCYRTEAYLPKCVESILSQNHQHLEVILVNDGSPDNCGAICDKFASADPRVKVIHQPNRGLSEARNAGLDIATGQYLLFIDSDDWVDEGLIETLLANSERCAAQISVSGLLRTATETISETVGQQPVITMSRAEALSQIVKPEYGSMVAACGKLFESSLFREIRFPPGRVHEDAFTTYKVILNTARVAVTARPMYFYRQHPESIMAQGFRLKNKLDIIDALSERSQIFREAGMVRLSNQSTGQVLSTYMEILENLRSIPPGLNGRFSPRHLGLRLLRSRQPIKFRALLTLAILSPKLGLAAYATVRARARD